MKSFLFRCLVVVVMITFVVGVRQTEAASGGVTGINDYGGYIISDVPCTCSGVYYLLVMDWSTMSVKPLSYIPGVSALKLDYNFYVPETFTLGQYTSGFYGECEIYNGEGCNPLPTIGFFSPHPNQGLGAALIPF